MRNQAALKNSHQSLFDFILSTFFLFTAISCAAQNGNVPIKAVTLEVDNQTDYVNVMNDEMPVIPSFPAVAKKAGYIRGYVKNVAGEPIAGAKLGLKSARMYDAYLANSAETDANGYYEIKIPTGGAKFDYAGLTRDIGRGKKGAVGLHPADGNLSESYPAASGGIENFVALPYGIGDAAGVSQSAKYRGNYYGGSFMLRYFIAPPGQSSDGFAGMLTADSEIVITLIPRTIVFDGSKFTRAFEIRKKIEDSSLGEFFICNVPLGEYEIAVRHPNGKFLKMRQKNPTDSTYGIVPQETSESASLIFNPLSTDAKTAVASRGNWTDLEIIVER